MTSDIMFYDFNMNLLYILPPNSSNNGYISINATQEYNGNGSLEMEYVSEELKNIVVAHKDDLIVRWGKFQGFMTSFINTDNTSRIIGMSLNGLLHRVVVPPQQLTESNIETLARTTVINQAEWLTLGELKGFTKISEHETTDYMYLDEYVKQLMETDSGGYKVTADFIGKRFIFECLKQNQNSLMLSENNLNAYDFQTTYNNKDMAFGGWYEQEQEEGDPIWKYISIDNTKTGINKIDRVLSAKTETEAIEELKSLKAQYNIEATTKDIHFETDYNLGDIVRVQNDGVTVFKMIKSVDLWQEDIYGECPTLSEVNNFE